MARDDQRYGITTQGLAHLSRQLRVANFRGQITVGFGLPGSDTLCALVHTAIERWHMSKVDLDPRKILKFAAKMRLDCTHRTAYFCRNGTGMSLGKSVEPCKQHGLAVLRQPNCEYSRRAKCDCAGSDSGLEYLVLPGRHSDRLRIITDVQ